MKKKAPQPAATEATFDDKKAAIHTFIEQKELVQFPELSDPLYVRLLNEIVAEMEGDAASQRNHFLKQWMFGNTPIVLHEGAMPVDGALFEVRDEGSRIHLYAKHYAI